MKKVKIIANTSAEWFEKNINSFIEKHDVTDIQFRPTSDEHGQVRYNAMLIYRE